MSQTLNPIGFSIAGTGTANTRLVLGQIKTGEPLALSSTNNVIESTTSLSSLTINDLTISNSLSPSVSISSNLGSSSKYWNYLYCKNIFNYSSVQPELTSALVDADGYVTITSSYVILDTYDSSSSLDLIRIIDPGWNQGTVIFLRTLSDSRDIVLKHNSYSSTGKIFTHTRSDITLSCNEAIVCLVKGLSGEWCTLSLNDYADSNYIFGKNIIPNTDTGISLGSSSYRINDIYTKNLYVSNNTGNASATIIGSNTGLSILNFGDTDSSEVGRILYYHTLNEMLFRVNSSDELSLSITSLYPTTNDGLSLGKSSNRWNDVYSTGAVDVYSSSGPAQLYLLADASNSYINILTGSTSYYSYINFGIDSDVDNGQILYSKNATKSFTFRVDDTNELMLDNSYLYPASDGGLSLGYSGHSWSQVWALDGTIHTSDERKKQDIKEINDTVLDAWSEVSLVFFRWIKSVKEKNENARIHAGVIAQSIVKAFANHGLNANDYGLLCYNEWEEKVERSEITEQDGTIKIIEKIIPAGNTYSIRGNECLFVESAYQRRRSSRIEERLSKLENKIETLENKLV